MGGEFNRLESYFDKHSEQLFILKSLALIAFLKLLEDVLSLWWFTLLVGAPFFVIFLLQIISIHQNKGISQVIRENLTLIPAPYLDNDKSHQITPWVTYCLILTNITIFYFVMPVLSKNVLNNLVFVPENITFINTLRSQMTNIFLHADGWHLWGNMAFLWAMGTVLEKRLGHEWLFGIFVATGCASNLLFLLVEYATTGYLSSSLGASGAISGLMGAYAVRCYFKTMIFPFPVLGLFSFVIPLGLKIRMNSLVVIGLFFWANMSASIEQVAGTNNDNVAYAAHLGGMLVGIAIAYKLKLGNEALQEKRLDTARIALDGKGYLGEEDGETAIREYLQENDTDTEALLLLARKISQYRLPDEGRDLYQKTILLLLQSDLNEAIVIFKEYFDKYQTPLDPTLQIRLAALIEKTGNLDFATRCLEMLLSKAELTSELRKKCLFHCSRLCTKMGLDEAAEMYQQKISCHDPGSI